MIQVGHEDVRPFSNAVDTGRLDPETGNKVWAVRAAVRPGAELGTQELAVDLGRPCSTRDDCKESSADSQLDGFQLQLTAGGILGASFGGGVMYFSADSFEPGSKMKAVFIQGEIGFFGGDIAVGAKTNIVSSKRISVGVRVLGVHLDTYPTVKIDKGNFDSGTYVGGAVDVYLSDYFRMGWAALYQVDRGNQAGKDAMPATIYGFEVTLMTGLF
jgi:hypothetical protein